MINAMAEGNQQLAKLMGQAFTGEKLTKISDDPVASIKLLGIDETLSKNNQYNDNINNIKNKYQLYETQFDSVENNLQDANELLLLAKNGTMDSTSFIVELESLKESFVSIFNSKDNHGAYMFAGTEINEAPFIKNTVTGEWEVNPQINNDTSEAVIADGVSLTNNFTTQDIDAEDILDLMNTAITELYKPTPDMNVVGATHDQLIVSLDKVSASTAKIGSGINNMDRTENIHLDTNLFAEELKGSLKDLNYDEASVKLDSYSQQLEASQKIFVQLSSLSLLSQV